MKTDLLSWVNKLQAAKEAAKATGHIVGDSDLAAIVSDKIEAAKLSKVDRGAVNHWLNGRRHPNVPQFIALCEALNVSPGQILGAAAADDKVVHFRINDAAVASYIPDVDAAMFDRLRQAPESTRRLALAAAMGVLEKSGSTKPQHRKRQR